MTETTGAPLSDPLVVAADIVSAYVSHNVVPVSGLPDLIASVHAAVARLGPAHPAEADGPKKATPAQIKKSISPDTLVSFEDGQPYKTLRRHLGLRGLTPEAYRAKWGLPVDYPMVSSAYSSRRSALARTLGLGQQRRTFPAKPGAPAKAPAPEPEAPAETPERTRRFRKVAEA